MTDLYISCVKGKGRDRVFPNNAVDEVVEVTKGVSETYLCMKTICPG